MHIQVYRTKETLSQVTSLEPPAPGYGVETLEWAVEVAPGQTELLNGTVEEVMSQASQINPRFKLKERAPVARSVIKRGNKICDNFPDKAIWWAINDGADYLRNLPGQPTNGPGPGNCGRVSCSYNSAIWWCNDVSGLPPHAHV
jgi:hypothetical protein